MLTNDKANGAIQINVQDIVHAFQTLANPANTQQLIKAADQYLSKCQSIPQFSVILISIFSQLPNNLTKTQVLIHLKNVIKRNWTIKRRTNQTCIMSQQIKQQIKIKLLQIYRQNWKLFYKQFNQIFKYLSRQDFPLNYQVLNQFVREVLTGLAGLGLEEVLRAEELLPYLSLVKVLYKQYAQRRMLHSIEAYQKYCQGNIDIAVKILQKLGQALLILQTNPQIQLKSAQKILQCSRKIDKIVLYCLQSIVTPLQFNNKIIEIVKFQLNKIQILLSLNNPHLKKQVQLNILAIIQLTSKLQTFFPFLFTQFLSQYLQMILKLLFSHHFQTQKLVTALILSTSRVIAFFSYYMDSNQYKLSLQYKKENQNNNVDNSQKICHQVYRAVYTSQNILTMLQKIVGQLMVRFSRESEDDQILFQDGGQQGIQQGVYQMLSDLVRVILKRFPQQRIIFTNKVIQYLLNLNNQKTISKMHNNMYQVILQLPKIFQQIQVPIQTIYKLMQKCYFSQNYNLFCRLFRNYMEHVSSQIPNFFSLLIQIIISNNPHPHTIYQAAACIRKILVDYEQLSLPLQKIGQCLTQILSLISIYKTVPTHLWNLLNLLIQILKALNVETVLINLKYLNSCIGSLVINGEKDNLITCALCDLMQCLLNLLDPEDSKYMEDKLQLYEIALKLVCSEDIKQEQQITQMSKGCLWLCVIKNINVKYCPEQLKIILLNMLQNRRQSLISSDPSLFFQILEQYLLSQILQINSGDLLNFYSSLVDQIQPQSDIRTLMSFFSLYHTYSLLTNDINQKIILISIQKIKQLQGKVSQSINSFRMILMMIVCTAILRLGAQPVFKMFNQFFGDYRVWFWVYISSLEYTSNKYSAKVNTITLLQALPLLKDVLLIQIDSNLPFDSILKFITFYVEPISYEQCLSNYASSIKSFSHSEQIKQKNKQHHLLKTHSRKIKLHVNAGYAELDLRPIYRQRIGELMRLWDWGVDDLEERYTKAVIQKVIKYLNGP